MPYLLPVHQVLAVEKRHTRIISKGGNSQKIIAFAIGANAGIGIPSRQNGIIKIIISRKRIGNIDIILTFIIKVIEKSDRLSYNCLLYTSDAADEL